MPESPAPNALQEILEETGLDGFVINVDGVYTDSIECMEAEDYIELLMYYGVTIPYEILDAHNIVYNPNEERELASVIYPNYEVYYGRYISEDELTEDLSMLSSFME